MLSIRWRLTLFFAAAILFIVGLLGAALTIVAIRGTGAEVEEESHARALEVARLLESGGRLDEATLNELAGDEVYVVLRDRAGNVVAESAHPAHLIENVGEEERTAIWRQAQADGEYAGSAPSELYVHALRVDAPAGPVAVVEAWKSYDVVGENIIPYGRIAVVVFPFLLVVIIVGSYLMARSSLAPVNAIVRSARQIGEQDLSRRLPVKRPHDELGQLAITFNDLLARLDVAFRQREETLARQRRFVADASHELRTPLTSIQGYARMLRTWALDDRATAEESVAAIEREAARMSELVERLLRLARGDEGPPLELATHDLGEVARSAVETARAAAQGRVGLVYRPPAAPVYATIDRERVREAVAILLDNAVKYTPEGGTITVAVRDNTNALELSVSDTGIGIAPEHLPHVFERFYRVDEARSAGGTGLGLSIARQIAEQHGGTIEVASTLGRGSTFTLRLPIPRPFDYNGRAPAEGLDRHPREAVSGPPTPPG